MIRLAQAMPILTAGNHWEKSFSPLAAATSPPTAATPEAGKKIKGRG
jgi:hypothetical protein